MSRQQQPAVLVRLYTGPMFAEKTTKLLSDLAMYNRQRMTSSVLFKPASDTRGPENMVVSHGGISTRCVVVKNAREIIAHLNMKIPDPKPRLMAIGIDEAQFIDDLRVLGAWVVDAHSRLAAWQDVDVHLIMAGLSSTFERRPFPEISNITPFCTEVYLLSGICDCCGMHPSRFSRRNVTDKQQLLIGGKDLYSATCQECFHHNNSNSNNNNNNDDDSGCPLYQKHLNSSNNKEKKT